MDLFGNQINIMVSLPRKKNAHKQKIFKYDFRGLGNLLRFMNPRHFDQSEAD